MDTREAHSGLIPAHAGKTPSATSTCRASRAHPRSRGENFCGCSAPDADWGSSPLTRGKLRTSTASTRWTGLIPAHAGKTMSSYPSRPCRWAHPRSRGENCLCLSVCATPRGSSPLTRGKPPRPPRPANPCGLIPAHAGKTKAFPQSRKSCWAHPRSRGENTGKLINGVTHRGSSPLTRGKQASSGGAA